MLKKYSILLFALFTTLVFSQRNQEILVEYEYTFVEDSLNRNNVKSETMQLYILPEQTVFIGKNLYIRDSIHHHRTNNNFVLNNAVNGVIKVDAINQGIPKTDLRYRIIHTRGKDNYTIHTTLGPTKFSFDDQMELLEWKLSNEREVFLGYNIQKAEVQALGRKWEVWYTEDIPLSYGPYKFHGLPGLIVKVQDSEHFFSYELKGLKKLNYQPEFHMSEKTYPIKKKDYTDFVAKYEANPLESLNFIKFSVQNENDFLQRKLRVIEKNNNFIEKDLKLRLK